MNALPLATDRVERFALIAIEDLTMVEMLTWPEPSPTEGWRIWAAMII